MIYGFDTTDENVAIAALCVYVVWRSRDRAKVEITPDIWGRVERFTKASAWTAKTLPVFIEQLKSSKRIYAPTLHPRYFEIGFKGEVPLVAVVDAQGRFSHAIRFNADRDIGRREFGTTVIERANHREVLRTIRKQTGWIINVVRERIEREKPMEAKIEATLLEEEGA